MRVCRDSDCEKPSHCRGWCKNHYEQWRRNKPIDEKTKMCGFKGCEKRHRANGYCSSHNYQYKNGIPLRKIIGTAPPEERFFHYVEKGRGIGGCCWNYTGTKNFYGYGVIASRGKRIGAHRFSWEYHNKQEIPEGMFVLHSCDNRACVNPDHLRIGTAQDNTNDMIERGRQRPPKGEDHFRSKLTTPEVLQIYKEASNGGHQPTIAKKYGINCSGVSRIKCGKIWSHVTGHKKETPNAQVLP